MNINRGILIASLILAPLAFSAGATAGEEGTESANRDRREVRAKANKAASIPCRILHNARISSPPGHTKFLSCYGRGATNRTAVQKRKDNPSKIWTDEKPRPQRQGVEAPGRGSKRALQPCLVHAKGYSSGKHYPQLSRDCRHKPVISRYDPGR